MQKAAICKQSRFWFYKTLLEMTNLELLRKVALDEVSKKKMKNKNHLLTLIFLSLNFICIGQVIESIGDGLTLGGVVHDLLVDDAQDKLYAAGYFTAIDGREMSNIGVYEEGEWRSISDTTTIEGQIFTMTIYQGELYIGGSFTIQKEKLIKNLAKLENGVWKGLSIDVINGSITDIEWFQGRLYAAGSYQMINHVRSDGMMMLEDGEWKRSGIQLRSNPYGLFQNSDSLFAWGNSMRNVVEENHSVSVLSNNGWARLAPLDEDFDASAFFYFKKSKFAIGHAVLYRYDNVKKEWLRLNKFSESLESPLFFKYGDELILSSKNLKFHRIEQDEVYDFMFKGMGGGGIPDLYTVVNWREQLVVGGKFHNWDSECVGLAQIVSGYMITLGQVSTRYFGGRANSMVTYKGRRLISGRFLFANGVYSPNFVYYDGKEFDPFEFPIRGFCFQLELFQGELFAVGLWQEPGLESFRLIKYDGVKWEGVDVPKRFRYIEIINDKLFANVNQEGNSTHGGPVYYQNGKWNQLKPYPTLGSPNGYRYGNVMPYKNGYAMTVDFYPKGYHVAYLANDSAKWSVLIDKIEPYVNYLTTFEDQIYFISEWPRRLYRYEDEDFHLVTEDTYVDDPHFFIMEGDTFYSPQSGPTFTIEDTVEHYISLPIRDVEKIRAKEYLLALNTSSVKIRDKLLHLNGLAKLTLDTIDATPVLKESKICENGFAEYEIQGKGIDYAFQWEFEGGTPISSRLSIPMVKYDSLGSFQTKLTAFSPDGDSLVKSVDVQVEQCHELNTRSYNYDNQWIMGNTALPGFGLGGFDFSFIDTIQSPRYDVPSELHSGTIVMSDKDGDLQFYSNGISIWNKNNSTVKGSECFNSDLEEYPLDFYLSNQSILSLPDAQNVDVYHIFDIDPLSIPGAYWLGGENLSLTSIDMSLEGGEGRIIKCNELIVEDTLLNSTMQATRHANGRDWWIVVGKYNSDEYYKILFTANGVELVESQKWNRNDADSLFRGQSVFSPNGDFFAQTIRGNQEISIWRFNNETGDFYDQKLISIATVDETEHPNGCAFSPNGRFLYVSSLTQMRQFDLCDYDAIESEIIDDWDGTIDFIYPLYFGKQGMLPTGQIIVSPYATGYETFGVIHSPNSKGKACNFIQNDLKKVRLTSNPNGALPFYPHFRSYETFTGDCGSVSTSGINNDDELMIFPNPSNGNNLVRFSQQCSGEVYSATGELISSFNDSDYIDIYALSPGIYFIKTEEATLKLVVQ